MIETSLTDTALRWPRSKPMWRRWLGVNTGHLSFCQPIRLG